MFFNYKLRCVITLDRNSMGMKFFSRASFHTQVITQGSFWLWVEHSDSTHSTLPLNAVIDFTTFGVQCSKKLMVYRGTRRYSFRSWTMRYIFSSVEQWMQKGRRTAQHARIPPSPSPPPRTTSTSRLVGNVLGSCYIVWSVLKTTWIWTHAQTKKSAFTDARATV